MNRIQNGEVSKVKQMLVVSKRCTDLPGGRIPLYCRRYYFGALLRITETCCHFPLPNAPKTDALFSSTRCVRISPIFLCPQKHLVPGFCLCYSGRLPGAKSQVWSDPHYNRVIFAVSHRPQSCRLSIIWYGRMYGLHVIHTRVY